ncbi:MAG: hypothetical protein EXS27_11290 [Pedosphaera sp.]|nr:hypothetical protein [Pedosphaera sp.]
MRCACGIATRRTRTRGGAPVRNLQEAMGHTQIEMTMRYLAPTAAGVRSPLDG